MRVGFPVVDTLTGQTAAFAIATALVRRGRTGAGDTIDVAMFDATLSFMTSAVVPWLVTGKAMARMGQVPARLPMSAFKRQPVGSSSVRAVSLPSR